MTWIRIEKKENFYARPFLSHILYTKKKLLAIRNGRLGLLDKDWNFKFRIDGFYLSFKEIV